MDGHEITFLNTYVNKKIMGVIESGGAEKNLGWGRGTLLVCFIKSFLILSCLSLQTIQL